MKMARWEKGAQGHEKESHEQRRKTYSPPTLPRTQTPSCQQHVYISCPIRDTRLCAVVRRQRRKGGGKKFRASCLWWFVNLLLLFCASLVCIF